MSFKRIEVAVGVLSRQSDQANGVQQREVLVAQRLVKDRYFEKWEFPGGKIEQGESPLTALSRELNEELEIQVLATSPLIQLDHNYPDRHVRLHVFEVNKFSGEPHGKEGQAIQWVKPQYCAELDFLQANEPIVNAVLLPKLMLITDIAKYGIERTLSRISSLQRKYGELIVQLRENTADVSLLVSYKTQIAPLLKQGSLLLLNGSPRVAEELNFDGVQLGAQRAGDVFNRDDIKLPWVGASCHDKDELQHAEKIADFALLSPIQATKSHPNLKPKEWGFFQQLAEQAVLPIYALGGLAPQDYEKARLQQGQGVAILSKAWD